MRASPAQTAFNAGELSPLLAMAFDFNKYRNGLKRLRNFLPTVQGPIYRRPAWRFAAPVKDSDATTWLYRFEYSVDAVYILEFGDQYVRFFANQARVLEAAKTITGVTQADPVVVESVAHGFTNGQDLELSGIGGAIELNQRSVRVANKTADTFELHDLRDNPIDGSGYGAFTAGGDAARVYEVATPWAGADLTNSDGTFALSIVQSQDALYICRAGYQPQKLIRTSSASWAIAPIETSAGPFEAFDYDTATTVYASAATGTGITLQASADIFEADHVGGLFLLDRKLTDDVKAWEVAKAITLGDVRRSQGNYYEALNTATTGTVTPAHSEGAVFDGDTGVQWQYLHSGYGWARITAFVDANTVTADVVSRIPAGAVGSGNATTRWAHGSFSDALGWPSFVAFFRERLVFEKDQILYLSVPRDYETFAERDGGIVASDSAFKHDLKGDRSDKVRWMASNEDLMIGTSGGGFAFSETSSSEPLGPGNNSSVELPGYGARQVAPVKVNAFLLFVQRSGRKVRELRFDGNSNGYIGLNRTVLSEHIVKGRVISLTYAAEPDSVVWGACANGDLLSFTFDPEHDVQAWAKHPIGGVDAKTRCVCGAPSPSADYDDVWAINSRTINGETWQYVEFLAPKFDADDMDLAEAKFVDSCLTATGAANIAAISGAWHLEGETVRILKDGAAHPDRVVTNGGFLLNSASASMVTFGLGYQSIAETMSLEAGAGEGTAQGKWKRIHSIVVRMFETVKGFFMGPDDEFQDPVGGVAANQQLGSAPALTTGDEQLDWPGDYERASYVVVNRDDAFPCTVIGLMPQLAVSETEG